MDDLRIYKTQRHVHYSDVDMHTQIKLSTLLGLVSNEIGEEHSQAQGFGREQMVQAGMVFLLSKVSMQIHRYPKGKEDILLTTFERKAQGVEFRRMFQVESLSGQLLACAETRWILASTHDHKILRPSAFPFQAHFLEQDLPVPPAKKIVPKGEAVCLGQRNILFSDMDFNQHMNNTRYADIVCDCLTKQLLDHEVTQFSINYTKEAKCFDTLQLFQSQHDNDFYIWGEAANMRCFMAQVCLKIR